LYWNLIC